MHGCELTIRATGPANLAVCTGCGGYEWTDQQGATMDPSDAIGAVYGPFVLIDRLDSIGAPGGNALVYRVPRPCRSRLDVFTVGDWTQIHPNLYASQDGVNLLLAPTDPAVSRQMGIAG